MNRNNLLPLLVPLALCSCVTTYSTSRKYIAVETPDRETVVMNGDTLRYGLTPRELAGALGAEPTEKNLARMTRIVYAANSPQTAYGFYDATPEPLHVAIHAADTVYSYTLEAYNSDLFWLNGLTLGVGMLEDRKNDNRYEHPDLYWAGDGYRTFRKNDWTMGVRKRRRPKTSVSRRTIRYENSFRKGRVNVSLAFPWLQLYSFSPITTAIRRNSGGCIGIAAGIEYLYRDKRGIALEANTLAGYATIWGPAANIDPPPNEEWSAIHITLAEYLHFRRFTIGYGLNAARNRYVYKPPYPGFGIYLGDMRIDDRYWAAGILVAAYINITPKMMFGATYRPTFFRFGTARPWQYEHCATLDLKFYLFRK
ncbi:MAG TPA: hypothetical protein H9866_07980 [Candidatus Tidjanibacter gallistercoris]|nr:hypothetical protein [Candidatus Tidjanibacter gallistercoris]